MSGTGVVFTSLDATAMYAGRTGFQLLRRDNGYVALMRKNYTSNKMGKLFFINSD